MSKKTKKVLKPHHVLQALEMHLEKNYQGKVLSFAKVRKSANYIQEKILANTTDEVYDLAMELQKKAENMPNKNNKNVSLWGEIKDVLQNALNNKGLSLSRKKIDNWILTRTGAFRDFGKKNLSQLTNEELTVFMKRMNEFVDRNGVKS